MAAREGHLAIVQWLILQGKADINVNNALTEAIKCQQEHTASFLYHHTEIPRTTVVVREYYDNLKEIEIKFLRTLFRFLNFTYTQSLISLMLSYYSPLASLTELAKNNIYSYVFALEQLKENRKIRSKEMAVVVDASTGELQEVPEHIIPTWQDINQVVFKNDLELFLFAQRKENSSLSEIKSIQQDKSLLQQQIIALQQDKFMLLQQISALQQDRLTIQPQTAAIKAIEELPETDEPMRSTSLMG